MKNAKSITPEMLERFKKSYDENPMSKVLTAAASKTELSEIAFSPMDAARMEHLFSIEIKTRGITAQQRSGRCWLFASMNLMREQVAEKCNLDMFELSGNYLAFWDKFEKMNFFLETAIDCADAEVADRVLDWLMMGINDGGQWDMMVSVIKKYGIVPAYIMPDTYQSSHTQIWGNMINMKLRKNAIELRKLVRAGIDPTQRKEEMLAELFQSMCICFGKPVDQFDFEYKDKDGVYHADYGMTPQSFYEKYVGINLDDYVSIIQAPTKDKPYGKSYTVQYLGNVVEGNVRYLNLSMEDMKELVIRQMKDGEPVWFGSDCSKYGCREGGFWDPASFKYGEILGGMDLWMTKEERLDYRDSAMNHAMVLVGVNLDQKGQPNRWKIENSWGEEAGKKGYYAASDAWFDAFVYQAIINKKYLTEEQLKAFEAEPIVLAPWDPMGSLA